MSSNASALTVHRRDVKFTHRPIHDRPAVTERWNYEDTKFTGDTARADALAWILVHAVAVAAAFPARFGR